MDTRISSNATPKPPDDYYLSCILKIAAASMVELPEASQAVYLERLRKLKATEMREATTRTIDEWTEASKMPPVAYILERAYVPPDETDRTRSILERPDKPADWEPLASGEIPRELYAVGSRAKVTKEEIAQWLADGKAKQLAHYAELAKDPKWRAQQARFGVPEYRKHAEAMAAERNGKSQIPEDQEERQRWAKAKAVEMGWATREPGDE